MASIFCKYEAGENVKLWADFVAYSTIKKNGVDIGQIQRTDVVDGDVFEFILNGTSTGVDTFNDCTKLIEVEIGEGVTEISNRTFLYCSKLQSVSIPDSVTIIGSSAFSNCKKLINVNIPNGVTEIKSSTFYHCDSLETIIIPDSVTNIEGSAFYYCISLKNITLPNIPIIESYTFDHCDSLETIIIPDSVEIIKNRAFSNCTSLESVTIGSGVKEIGDVAFWVCTSLSHIISKCIVPPTIEDETFLGVSQNGTLEYPEGSDYSTWLKTDEYYLGYYNWNGVNIDPDEPDEPNPDEPDLPDISNPDKYSILCLYQGGTNIKICSSVYKFSEIKINGVAIDNTSVNGSSNRNQDLLSTDVVEFIVSDGIIPETAFWGCDALVSVSIGDGITDINSGAFGKCESLKEITATPKIPPTIHGVTVFNGVAKYGTLNYPEGSDYNSWLKTDYGFLGRCLWNNYTEYTNKITCRWGKSGIPITLPDDVDSIILDIVVNGESIGNNTHTLDYSDIVEYIVSGIEVPPLGDIWGHVTIGEGFEIINKGSTTIETIDFPSTLKIIGAEAFRGSSLTHLTIPKSVVYIGERAFDESTKLVQVKIGDVNKEGGGSDCVIGPYAFSECDIMENYSSGRDVVYSGLQEIIIGDNVIKIDEGAFLLNHNLKYLTIGDGCRYIGDYAFDSCSYIPDIADTSYYIGPEEITIGSGCTYIGKEAFNNWGALNHITITAPVAPRIIDDTFWVVKKYGTLDFPKGSNYSQWLSPNQTYLGYYHWNNVGMGYYYFNLETNTLDITKEAQVIYLDYSSNGDMDMTFVHPSWISVTQGDGYLIIEVNENDGLYRTGEIEISALAENFEQFTEKLIINQEGIEDMATSIALYKTQLTFPASGGTQYVQVDYINANVINAPYCSQSWVTIEQTQQGTAIDGNNTIYQRQYKITMAATSTARQVQVKFSCTSASGVEVSTDKLYLYQAAPTENPDDGEGETGISAFSTKVKVKIDGTPEYSSGNNLGVGYENLTPGALSVDVDWIHVGAGVEDTGVSTYDTVMRYPTTYDANEGPERTGTITWTGIDGYGNAYTATTTVTQYGTDTPLDEGMIELESLSVTLPAEGGSDIMYVKYYDARTIYDPEFVGDWGTIIEINSEESTGTDFNGDVCVVIRKTYKITATATDASRMAKVIFKADINNGDSVIVMEKDKFKVYQLADGATEIKGYIYPFSNTLKFDSKGKPTDDTIWSEARIGYKGVTIEEPYINVSWVRIKNVTDKTYGSKEYDHIYYYALEFDENTSVSSRQGTITFSGYDEDGNLVKATVTVIQKGYDTDIDDDTISKNYKGYFRSLECDLYSVSFITDPYYDSYSEITLAGESPVIISYKESDRLYDPVRTSTCTIRVLTKNYLSNLYTGKAQGVQVIVKNEDTGDIKWCGFLQPNLYNQGYTNEIEEVEFEASDCLSTLQYLEYKDYFVNGRQSVSFKNIVDDIMDRCKLISSYYITEKYYNDTYRSRPVNFNNFFISEHNFFSEEDEPWTLDEVLQETCKYFGVVCYQWGDAVYFIDYDQYNSDKVMKGYRWEKNDYWVSRQYVTIASTAQEIIAESYMDTGADISMDDVFNKVSVKCNYYEIDNIIPDLFDDDLLTNRMEDEGYLKIRRYTGRGNSILANETYYRLYDHRDVDNKYYIPLSGTTTHEQVATPTADDMKTRRIIEDYVGANIIDMIHLDYNAANGKPSDSKDWERYLMISQLNRPWCGAEGTFHWENYNFPVMEFKNIPTVFLDNTQDTGGRPGRPIKPQNYLVIDAEAAFVSLQKESYLDDGIVKGMKEKRGGEYYEYMDGAYTFDHINESPALVFYLEVPQKGWWNGTGWVDYKTYFEVPLDELDYENEFFGVSKSVQNTVSANLFLGASGYKIPLPQEMDSTRFMYFAIGMPKRTAHQSDIQGGDYTGDAGNAYCFIKKLEVKICNLYSTLWEDADMVYENIIDEDFVVDGDEIDFKITSDNNKIYSLSTVATIAENDVQTTDISFYGINGEPLKADVV